MSLRINSDFNGVTDPDAGAYIAAVEAADGQLLEFGVGKAINDFVVGCKADGIWDAIKASCILAGARTRLGALTPLKGAAPTSFNFVDGDYNRETGLVGDGSTKYLNSNRASNADPQNNLHVSAFFSTVGTGIAAGVGNFLSGSVTLSQLAIRSRQAAAVTGGTVSANTFSGCNRSNATDVVRRLNGASTTSSSSSQASLASTTYIFADNDTVGGISPNSYATHRLAFYSIGESLDLAKLDTRVSALITAIGAAIP